MAKYLLDTTVIIDYLRGKDKTVKLIRKLFFEGSFLGCCPINVIEVYAGMKEKDVAIAGIAVANDLILLTDNQKHYPMPKLKIYLPDQLWKKFE